LPPLFPPGLYALCDDTFRPELPVTRQAQAFLEAGVRTLQLRFKRTAMREALPLAREVAGLCRRGDAWLIINDRVDLALLCGAEGAHLGEEDLSPAEARMILGPQAVIGATVRSIDQAQAARAAGASYVGVGPVFSTTTKVVPAPVLGLRSFGELVARSPLPVVAIGGISLENIAQVSATGAHSAAVLSALLSASDLAAQARLLQAAFERGRMRGAGSP
jgi:thiamine-phosphate pyrophosphorylase